MHQEEFDVVIIGTGLVQSILAAAFSRAGLKVLFTDKNRFYGGDEASVTLSELELLQSDDENKMSKLQVLEMRGDIPEDNASIVLDLSPYLVFSRGLAVETIAESGVSRYVEFQTIDSIQHLSSDSSEPLLVPQSKAEIFSSKSVSMSEKRQLMRFTQFCVDMGHKQQHSDVSWANDKVGAANPGRSLSRPQNKNNEQVHALESRTYESLADFLREEIRMGDSLAQTLLYSTACQRSQSNPISFSCGLGNVIKHVSSLGRFGNTPFLHPVYGIGELCQGFSRLCAVYGGTCMLGVGATYEQNQGVVRLDRPVAGFPDTVKPKRATIVNAADGMARTRWHLILGCDRDLFQHDTSGGGGQVYFTVAASDEHDSRVDGVQLSSKSRCVPANSFLVHMICESPDCKERLYRIAESLASRAQTTVGWTILLEQHITFDDITGDDQVFKIGAKGAEANDTIVMDVDDLFDRARRIFRAVLPGEAFLAASDTELALRRQELEERDVF